MFHPSNHVYKGGNYATTVSTNKIFNKIIKNDDIRKILNETNNVEYIDVYDLNIKEDELTAEYISTLSVISAAVELLENDYNDKLSASKISTEQKAGAFENYQSKIKLLDTLSSAYLVSTIYYSSLVFEFSTITSEVKLLINESTTSNYLISSYLNLFTLSTAKGVIIGDNIKRYNNLMSKIIPSYLSTLNIYSSAYTSAVNSYSEQYLTIISTNKLITDTNNLIEISTSMKEIIDRRILSMYDSYMNTKGLLLADDMTTKHLSTAKSEMDAYIPYSSTLNMMYQIENLYNLVINGLSVSKDFIDAVGLRGGSREHTPQFKVSPIVCDPGDTECLKNKEFLDKYIGVYHTLSTVLPTYESNYAFWSKEYDDVLKETPFLLSTNYVDILLEYDSRLKNALKSININTPALKQSVLDYDILHADYYSSTIKLSTSLFRSDQLEILTKGVKPGGTMLTGGGKMLTGGLIAIDKQKYSAKNIDEEYLQNMSTYIITRKQERINYARLHDIYISSLITLNVASAHNKVIDNFVEEKEEQIIPVRAILAANHNSLSSIMIQSSTLTKLLSTFKSDIIQDNRNVITNSLTTLNNSLNIFKPSTILLNAALENKFNSEMNSYIEIIGQISTIALWDIAEKQIKHVEINGEPSTTDPKINTLINFLNISQDYLNMLFSEQLYRYNYCYAKTIYEIECALQISQQNQSELMSPVDFSKLSLMYNSYASQVNNSVENRKAYNSSYMLNISSLITSNISTGKAILEAAEIEAMTSPRPYVLTNTGNSVSTLVSVPRLYPYSMSFEYVSSPKNLFISGNIIPKTNIPSCISTNIDVGTPVLIENNFNLQTPTESSRVYGVECQFIQIKKNDNNLEILQIIALDRFGKNVAFNASVTVKPDNVNSSNKNSITNGKYTPTSISSNPYVQYTNDYFSSPDSSTVPKIVEINLGKMCDITAIKYIKNNASYSSVGISVSLFDSEMNLVRPNPMEIIIDLPSTTFDLRASTSDLNSQIAINKTRYGIYGLMGRYIKISSSSYNYSLSQITVIAPDGTNLALNSSIMASFDNTSTAISLLKNGTYRSLPRSESFVRFSNNQNDYICIDLKSEYEISAINIYYASGDLKYNNTATVTVYTEDNLIAATRTTSAYHGEILKEIIDFKVSGSPQCYNSVKWEPYYGVAGIIGQYVNLTSNARMSFTKIEVIDKTGMDVALFQEVTASSNQLIAAKAVSNSVSVPVRILPITKPSNEAYYSSTGPNTYLINFGLLKEICTIRIYGCTDTDLGGISVSVLNASRSVLKTFTLKNGISVQAFDTRYEPTLSQYPTTVQKSIAQRGSYGTYVKSVNVYANSPPTVNIVDATGKNITYTLSTSPYINNGVSLILYKYVLARVYEITSVIVDANNRNVNVKIFDCNNQVVGQANASNSTSYNSGYYADFRNLWNGYPNTFAPVVPYLQRRGGYDLGAFNKPIGKHDLTGTYSSTGVKARYIEIIPADNTTPLYISQIIVVDEFGINRAYNASTYYEGTPSFPEGASNMVDGVYEANIDSNDFLQLFFQKYKRKPNNVNESYICIPPSPVPSQNSFNPSPMTIIDIGLDTTNPPIIITRGKEYSINSVIYVASQNCGDKAVGVIIRLRDDNLNIVGSQMVTEMANVFGVDILDFRADPTVSMDTLPNMVEVRPRIIEVGPEEKGIMTQYIRIEQTDPTKLIQISQVIVTDTNGINVAAFKPTYSPYNKYMTYNIVDGRYYTKLAENAYSSLVPGPNNYIEINLEKEYEIITLQVADINGGSQGFGSLRAKTLNGSRDIIASQLRFVPKAITDEFGINRQESDSQSLTNISLDTSNFLYLEKVGVQIADNLVAYKYNSGNIIAAAITSFSTMTTVPSLLTQPSNKANTDNYVPSMYYTRVNGGIPTRYVRVYNVDNYIQISQLMVYDTTGNNVAYKKVATATSTLPNCYAQYAVDGYGGFFHQPRSEPNCYISGNNRYDYWEVDLGAVFNVIAVRYIPPSTYQERNVGTRIQLLGTPTSTTTFPNPDSKTVLIQLPIKEAGDTILDFRDVSTPSIYDVLTPIIRTLRTEPNVLYGAFHKSNNSNDKSLYYIKLNTQTVHKITSVNGPGSDVVYTDVTSSNFGNMVYKNASSIYYDSTTQSLYVADFYMNTIYKNGVSFITGIVNPYHITMFNGTLYICENRMDGKLYSYTTQLNILYTYSYMTCFDFDGAGNIYICVPGESSLIIVSSNSTKKLLPIKYPSGIAFDRLNNILYISDVQENMIYALYPGFFMPIAGTGVAGYSGDGYSSGFSVLNGPFYIQYDQTTGYLFISDKYNGAIRIINFQSGPSAPISSTTTNPPAFETTTLVRSESSFSPVQSVSYTPPVVIDDTYTFYIKESTIKTPIVVDNNRNLFTNDTYIYYSTYNLTMYLFSNKILYRITETYNNLNKTWSCNILNIRSTNISTVYSMTNELSILYLVGETQIFTLDTANTNSSPVPYIGMENSIKYTIDGTPHTEISLNPYGIYFNVHDNLLYFTDIQRNGLVRKIDAFNKLVTVAGNYRSINQFPDTTSYYAFTSDIIRPEVDAFAINLRMPQGLIADLNGNLYIADSVTNCIHRLTPYGSLQPVCGPFRKETVNFLNEYATDTIYKAYSVKINTPSCLTFDSEMNLICTSRDGCQIVKISNLDAFEPSVQVISGIGIDINNIDTFNKTYEYFAKYATIEYPSSIAYSYYSNSLYISSKHGTNYVVRQLEMPVKSVLYRGNNGNIQYNLVNIFGYNRILAVNMDKFAPTLDFQGAPIHIATNLNGNLYYINKNQKNVFSLQTGVTNFTIASDLYNPNSVGGSIIDTPIINNIYNATQKGLYNPVGVIIHKQSIVYYVDTGNRNIIYIDIIQNDNGIGGILLTDPDLQNARYISNHENGCTWISCVNKIKFVYLRDLAPTLRNYILPVPTTATTYGPIWVDSVNNYLYVASHSYDSNASLRNNMNTITRYKINFNYTPQFTSFSLKFLDPPTNITSITTDTVGNIYCSDSSAVYRVLNGTANYNTLTGFSNPKSMHFYGNTSLYIADTGNNNIKYIDTTSGFSTTPKVCQTPYEFSSPSGVYRRNNYLYVAETGNNKISIFTITSSYTLKHEYSYDTTLYGGAPVAVVVDMYNVIYYTTLSNNIRKINTGINSIFYTFLRPAGQLSSVGQLFIDTNNNIYTKDTDRIYKITPSLIMTVENVIPGLNTFGIFNNNIYYSTDHLLKSFTINREAVCTTDTSWSITVAPNNMGNFSAVTITSITTYENLIYCSANCTLRVLNRNDSYVFSLLHGGSNYIAICGSITGSTEDTEFPSPTFITKLNNIDIIKFMPAGNLIISDNRTYKMNNNIQMNILLNINKNNPVNKNYAYTTSGYPTLSNYSGDGIFASQTTLVSPKATTYDKYGNLYIADNKCVRKVNKAGIIKTIATLLDKIVDIQIDKMQALCMLTSNAVYRSTQNGDTYTTPILIAGGPNSVYNDGEMAINVKLQHCRSIRFDNIGNLYIAESFPLTNRLSEIMETSVLPVALTAYNSATIRLYGEIITPENKASITKPPYYGGSAKTNWDVENSLFGSDSNNLTGTPNNPFGGVKRNCDSNLTDLYGGVNFDAVTHTPASLLGQYNSKVREIWGGTVEGQAPTPTSLLGLDNAAKSLCEHTSSVYKLMSLISSDVGYWEIINNLVYNSPFYYITGSEITGARKKDHMFIPGRDYITDTYRGPLNTLLNNVKSLTYGNNTKTIENAITSLKHNLIYDITNSLGQGGIVYNYTQHDSPNTIIGLNNLKNKGDLKWGYKSNQSEWIQSGYVETPENSDLSIMQASVGGIYNIVVGVQRALTGIYGVLADTLSNYRNALLNRYGDTILPSPAFPRSGTLFKYNEAIKLLYGRIPKPDVLTTGIIYRYNTKINEYYGHFVDIRNPTHIHAPTSASNLGRYRALLTQCYGVSEYMPVNPGGTFNAYNNDLIQYNANNIANSIPINGENGVQDYRENLYGKSTPTDADMTPPFTGGSAKAYNTAYYNLYGVNIPNFRLPATPSYAQPTPTPTSLLGRYSSTNKLYGNGSFANPAVGSVLYNYINTHRLLYGTIFVISGNTLTPTGGTARYPGQDSMAFRLNSALVINGMPNYNTWLSNPNIHYFARFYTEQFEKLYGDNALRVETNGFPIDVFKPLSTVTKGYLYDYIRTMNEMCGTSLNIFDGQVTNGFNTIIPLCTAVNSDITSSYEAQMIICYGQKTYTNTPTSGALANFKRDIDLYNTGNLWVPTSHQIETNLTNRSARISKVDLNGIITSYRTNRLIDLKEISGFVINSVNTIYIVDHYTSALISIDVNGNINFSMNLSPYSPHSIVLDVNQMFAYVSCDNSDIKYIRSNGYGSTILKCNLSNMTYEVLIGNRNIRAAAPYSKFYGNQMNPNLLNPQSLSIDKNNRLSFVQDSLNSVVLAALNETTTTVTVKSIKIQPSVKGNAIYVGSIMINSTNISNTDATFRNSLGVVTFTSSEFNYKSPIEEDPYLLITFNSEKTFTSLTVKGSQIYAVGLYVSLYDTNNNLISNRKTTNDVLLSGCVFKYDTINISKS